MEFCLLRQIVWIINSFQWRSFDNDCFYTENRLKTGWQCFRGTFVRLRFGTILLRVRSSSRISKRRMKVPLLRRHYARLAQSIAASPWIYRIRTRPNIISRRSCYFYRCVWQELSWPTSLPLICTLYKRLQTTRRRLIYIQNSTFGGIPINTDELVVTRQNMGAPERASSICKLRLWWRKTSLNTDHRFSYPKS